MAWLTKSQINELGFSRVGKNSKLSSKASFYNCSNISIGDHVRVDDFCVLSAGEGGISIGQHVHIAVYSSLIGSGVISLGDFAGISSRVSIFSSDDDYSGATLTGPTVPRRYTNVKHADVFIGKHTIVGSGSVILPGVRLEDGVAIGALSLVTKDCDAFCIYLGVPARKVKNRKRDLLEFESRLLANEKSDHSDI